jgi:hypothetical protein
VELTGANGLACLDGRSGSIHGRRFSVLANGEEEEREELKAVV